MKNEKPFRSAKEIVADMGVGFNLSNTLDATYPKRIEKATVAPRPTLLDIETSWLNEKDNAAPLYKTNSSHFKLFKDAGFKSVRIPITWHKVLEDEAFTIRADWMERVKEIVDLSLEEDLYVIINTHHDNGRDGDTPEQVPFALENEFFDRTKKRFASVWKQIADTFKDYDDRLIFEDLNEPSELGHFGKATYDTTLNNLNELHQIFVDIVRQSGGNNAERSLIIMPLSAKVYLKELKLPETDNLIVSVHEYGKYEFSIKPGGGGTFSADNEADTKAIIEVLGEAFDLFVSRGIPVIAGEFGALNVGNSAFKDIKEYYDFYFTYASSKGIPCFLWTHQPSENAEYFIKHKTCEWSYPDILEVIQKHMPA
jgi:endoglucanase